MNILNKAAFQGLKKNRTRTIVTIIGVILSAALITAVTTFGVSLLTYMTNGAVSKYGSWHVAFWNVDSSFIQENSESDEVKDTASIENIGYAKLDSSNENSKPYLYIAGYSEEAFHMLPVTLLSGRMPENSNEVLVSGKVSIESGVKFSVGDSITLTLGKRMDGSEELWQNKEYNEDEIFIPQGKKTYKVVGICQRPHFEGNSAPGYTMITKADDLEGTDNLNIFVTMKNPQHVHDYAKTISGDNSYSFNNYVLRFMGISDDPGDKIFNTLLYSVGGIVIAIIMVGSIFLIYNSFNISLNERTQQFGILMSVGATAKQLRNSVVFEGVCIGAVGIPIGMAVGLGGIKLVIYIVSKRFSNVLYADVPLKMVISVPVLLVAAAVSLATILISAYIPAIKAVNTPVMECIRQTNEIKIDAGSIKISKFSQRIFGLEGILALKNFKRNKKRYRSIVLSLVLSVVLFISTSSFVINMKQISGENTQMTTYDVGVAVQDMDDKDMISLYDKLKNADGVYESSYQTLVTYSTNVNEEQLTEDYFNNGKSQSADDTVQLSMDVQFIDDNTYLNIIRKLGLKEDEYTGQDAKLIAVAGIEKAGGYTDLFKKSNMDFTIVPKTNNGIESSQGKDVSITFVNMIVPDTLPILGKREANKTPFSVMAPYSLKEQYITPETHIDVEGMTFKSNTPSKSVDEMEKIIEGSSVTAKYNLYNMNKMIDESRNYIFIANVFSYTFIVLISLIAAVNVFNTISTNIRLRRRELAMLRSIGMSEHDFQKMMNFECAFYGIRALIVGLPVALLFSWLIYKGMFIGGAEEISFVLPWGSICISIISVLLVVFVTMLYSTNKIKQENIIDVLRNDMN